MTEADLVTVEQCDRDAAAELLGGASPRGLQDGKQDTLSLVRILARHRLAAIAAERARGQAALREARAQHDADMIDVRAKVYGILREHDVSEQCFAEVASVLYAEVKSRAALGKMGGA